MQWALSFTKKVVCSDNTPLSGDFVELLLLNESKFYILTKITHEYVGIVYTFLYVYTLLSDLKELTLERCDLVSAKALAECRMFKYITIGDRMHKGWRRFRISAEIMKLNFDSFQNIISNSFVKINTVSIDCRSDDITGNIRKLGLWLVFLLLLF